jgi:hypothetical protein
MPPLTPIEATFGMHAIEASATAREARAQMEALGVDWLMVCREGVLVGTIDAEQVAAGDDGLPVDTLAESSVGRVRWRDRA